jgi:hypothetical protein
MSVAQGAEATADYRWLSLNPIRASPPATTRPIRLTHIGIDQSPMMMVLLPRNIVGIVRSYGPTSSN